MSTSKEDGFLRLSYREGTEFLSRFRAFIRRGNVVDLAVGVVIGASFGKIVSSLVGDLLMPPLGLVLARLDFRQLRLVLKEAQGDQPAVTMNYGVFFSNILDFLIVALVVFLLIQVLHRFQEAPPAPPSTKECRFCASPIPLKAVRCPLCTSDLGTPVADGNPGPL